ncbi:hypothetical protein SDC9_38841 [bioreactor metagenome]|uniref:Secretion system C-terminal sorting domain-containing protein n=1 Tax=bioreactor metagenome TaxID=1076179 RepID=A0A644VN03_9ZZZZ
MKSIGIIFALLLMLLANPSYCQPVPYSTDNTHLTIWNGTEYVPFFIKGTNLGISVPGTFPGELAATRSEYAKWFTEIKDAGFNCIRLYTLHFPSFYEVLDSFNLQNPQNPLLFMQGVWLNEELTGYANDLTFLTDTFYAEIEENVDCVHGNRTIPVRQGKAYGTYSSDASKWCLAYIIGREVFPDEILTTNANNPGMTGFSGNHFSIAGATASETWITGSLDHLVTYENAGYNTQRPVSMSSWPTLDPLTHPEEMNHDEDTASVDLSKISIVDAPAGLFISYHAYPYYPDFISEQSDYLTWFDNYGSNSYLGYLNALKAHYPDYPLIIAECGVPSSWGIAHYSSSGMNHGGFDETGQGETNIRILKTIESSGCGGGIHFSWIDEWFKRTWITDPLDYIPESRVRWHNIEAAEQNFGLTRFMKTPAMQSLASFGSLSPVTEIKADANYSFFEMEIGLLNPLNIPDEMWIALDTYADNLGESQLPNGTVIPHRSEFSLHITNYSADLYVTQAYDTYGIWHHISDPMQMYHSIASDGAPWYIVRWKNNSGYSAVQYVGSLQVNYSFQNPSSKDAITIYDDKIAIRLPWSLLNVVAPDQLKVLNDNRLTPATEDTVTDGINIAVWYDSVWVTTPDRFLWNTWSTVSADSLIDTLKTSYFVMKDRLPEFNTPAVAVRDSFEFVDEFYPVTVASVDGVLKNDFDLDGSLLVALITQPPANGQVQLNNDGSFVYYPFAAFNGVDSFRYCLFDGYSLSAENSAVLTVSGNTGLGDVAKADEAFIHVFPNPAESYVNIETSDIFDEIKIFDSNGQLVSSSAYGSRMHSVDVKNLNEGVYYIVGLYRDKYYTARFMKM